MLLYLRRKIKENDIHGRHSLLPYRITIKVPSFRTSFPLTPVTVIK